MSWPLSYSLIRLPLDTEEFSATMEAKFDAHVGAKALLARIRSLKAPEICRECGGVGMKVSIHLGTPVPCCRCRPDAFAEFFAALAYEYEVVRPVMAQEPADEGSYGSGFCTMPRLEVDPWDMDESELNHTAALPREEPRFPRARDEYDPLDDKSDLQPFTKTGKL